MINLIQDVLESDEKSDLRQFASQLRISDKRYLLRNDILAAFNEYCTTHNKPGYFFQTSHLGQLIYYTQEIILENESLCFIIRPKIASQEVFRIFEDLSVESVTAQELLDVRDRFVNHYHPQEGDVLELDFQPFYDYSPTIRDPKNIGKGVRFLNRYLSSKLFQDPRQWLESLYTFLRVHQFQGTQLLINGRIKSQQELSDQVKRALMFVSDRP
ncbi:MAG TPA: sucrose synthase, partial [Chroococcales cyanobacterium]